MSKKETASNWAQKTWDKFYDKKITDGSKPKETMSREEFVVMLKRLDDRGGRL